MPHTVNAPDLLADLIARARNAGADAADAMLVESAGLSATRRLGKLEKIERAEGRDLGLRVFIGKRQALVATGDLGGTSLDRLVENALAIARAVPEDRYAGLADADQIARELPGLDLDDGQEPAPSASGEARSGGRGRSTRPSEDHQLRRRRSPLVALADDARRVQRLRRQHHARATA